MSIKLYTYHNIHLQLDCHLKLFWSIVSLVRNKISTFRLFIWFQLVGNSTFLIFFLFYNLHSYFFIKLIFFLLTL